MANNYMTTDDLNRLGIKWREKDGALVPAERVSLHPEADARLAAATGSGPATVYRIEAAVTNGPRFAIVGTLAEIDARLRSGLVGVDVATGATGKASEWPHVAEKMRTEWARTMASTLRIADEAEGMTAEKFVDIARAAKPSLVPAATWNGVPAPSEPVSTGARFFDGTRLDPGDTVSVECDAEGKWTARVRGAAPGSYARAQAVDFTGAGATLTDRDESVKAIRDSVTERMRAKESQRTKPAALAAGQVWLCGDTQWILDEQEPKHPSFWNARTSIGQRGLLSAITVMGMRYLGTREEVAARETGPSARAMRVGAAVAEGMARGVAMGLSRTPLGTMTAAPAPVPVVRDMLGSSADAWLDAIAEQWYGVKRSAGETDEALRARCKVAREAPSAAPAKPSPLAALRAEIDRLIAADSGPFAHARAAALRCYGEAIPSGLGEPIALRDVGRLHAALLRYESVRCGARTPAATHDARREAGLIEPAVLATYERERARSDVYARPARR